MWKVFNMGIGYCVIVRPTFAEGVTAKLEAAGETVRKIGVVRKGRTGVELTA
jgi:phosphoribosylformylglycinamidine cyclo-ligase